MSTDPNSTPVYHSASNRARIAVILMAVIILFSVLSIVTAVIELNIYSNYSDQQTLYDITDDEAVTVFIVGMVQMLWLVLVILFIIIYLMWKYLVFHNLQAARVQGLKHSPRGAAGWYFVPFANLIKPYEVMKEIWQATFYSEGTEAWKDRKASRLITFWWLTYLIGNVIAGQNTFNHDGTIGSYRMDAILICISEPLIIAAGVLLIVLIKRITDEQDRRLEDHREKYDRYDTNQIW
jgi:hypothetical protein